MGAEPPAAPSGQPPLALIAGPTASGKSALALQLAEAEGGTIINADASQVYRDLTILSARPTDADLASAPHRLFGHIDGAEACTATRWAAEARTAIAETHAEGRLPILVGGTGLYIRTLLEGIAPVPPVDPAIRTAIRHMPAQAVRTALEAEDKAMADRLHPNDQQRNARALEVVRSTGRSLAHWQAAPPEGGLAPHVQLRPLVVDLPREALTARIDTRIDAMWEAGALDEARRLADRRLSATLPVMRAIGVPPLLALLAGTLSQADAIARWKLDTRQYAKRQATWLRNQLPHWPRIKTAQPDSPATD